MRKKAIIFATAVIMIVVVVFFEFQVFRLPIQQTTTVSIILSNPSAWVNKTVAVEGDIDLFLPPGWWDPPYQYNLSFNGTTIGVFWQGNRYNGNVLVKGVVTTGQWTGVFVNGTKIYSTTFGPFVYFIQAERINIL
jgi:hypothetical protein